MIYCQPESGSFEALDAFAIIQRKLVDGQPGLCCVGFQSTTADTHIVKRGGAKRVRDKCRSLLGLPDLPLFIMFVTIPNGIQKAQKLGKVTHQSDAEFTQYVLHGIDFGEIMKRFGTGEGEANDSDEGEDEEG
jgi:hypothetical protein